MNKFPTTQKKVKIDEIYPNKWNCNLQSDFMFEKEKKSIQEFGFVQPILVRETDGFYEIIDGEHRWRACKQLQFSEILIESLGEIPDSLAKILTINLNNIRGQDDILKRAEILKQLKAGQLGLLPFDQAQIDAEIKLLSFDFSQFENVEINEEDQDISLMILKKMEELGILMSRLNTETKARKIKHLIVQYLDILSVFRLICKKK